MRGGFFYKDCFWETRKVLDSSSSWFKHPVWLRTLAFVFEHVAVVNGKFS